MLQQISISITEVELRKIISEAVSEAVDRRLRPVEKDELYDTNQAREFLRCSTVFLWKIRKEGKVKAVAAGKKVLYPKSELDKYLKIKKG